MDDMTAPFLRIVYELSNRIIRSYDDRSVRAFSYAPAKLLARTEMKRCFLLVSDSEKYQRTQFFIPRTIHVTPLRYMSLRCLRNMLPGYCVN